MLDTLYENKKLNPKKLLLFGFSLDQGSFTYSTSIAGGLFEMNVKVSADGTVSAIVLDASSKEEYVLHRTTRADGSFV